MANDIQKYQIQKEINQYNSDTNIYTTGST